MSQIFQRDFCYPELRNFHNGAGMESNLLTMKNNAIFPKFVQSVLYINHQSTSEKFFCLCHLNYAHCAKYRKLI